MATFTFTDFMVFSGVTSVNEHTYVTIAKGVLGYINNHYNIYPEVETIIQKQFLEPKQLSILPKAYPIENVYRLWYDGELIEDTAYSYYGEDILFDVEFVDVRKPLTLELDVGFQNNAVPDDLVLAVYRHIAAVYHAIDKHTDNISKSVNSDGNTAYYNNDVVPPASKQVYEFYAGHTLLVS